MVKPLRTVFTALFVMSVICLVGCNRWCDCLSPCEVNCTPKCCPPRAEPACPAEDDSCSCGDPCDTSNPYFPCNPSVAPCGNGKCQPSFPEECCYKNMRTYSTCDDCVVSLCQQAPQCATVGSPYPVYITITARKECANVVVNQTLPCDSEFVQSEPAAKPNEKNELSWKFPHMVKGETQTICVWVKPMREGCCLAAATVCACPQLCAYTTCGQPVICIEKCGPECACINCPVRYCIQVSNSGSAVAYDVVVQDRVPEGLCHRSGRRCLTYQLGTLCPGDCKRFTVDFCAEKRGMVCNRATVTYCGGAECTAEACTMINEPCVELSKTGPDWAYICKEVDYTITVTNPGDLVLYDVVVDDISPAGTVIVNAPGADVCCNRAVWCLCELCPGETKTFSITVKSQVPGKLTNRVQVTSQSCCGPCTMCAEATTLWKGIAATHMCMVDTKDPICIGETTVYRVCVTNRGTATDTNVQLVIHFTDELKPLNAGGASKGNVSGNTVTFQPIEKLSPKQSVEYCVTVKGVSVGDARAEARLSSDMLSSPVTDTESTHVY